MKLSIIIATLNCKKDLEKTLQSIFAQQVSDAEILVIDGGSTDGTLDSIRPHKDRLRYISEPDEGIYDAMNKGLRLAKGDYLQFLNAGDTFYDETSLGLVMPHLGGVHDVVFGDIHLVDCTGKSLQNVLYTEFTLEKLRHRGTATCNHQAFFVKKTVAPTYSLKYKIKGELDWYLNLAYKQDLKCFHLAKVIITYQTGGYGYVNFWLNLYEWLCVIQKHFGFLQNIRNHRTYLFFIGYRYPVFSRFLGRTYEPGRLFVNRLISLLKF